MDALEVILESDAIGITFTIAFSKRPTTEDIRPFWLLEGLIFKYLVEIGYISKEGKVLHPFSVQKVIVPLLPTNNRYAVVFRFYKKPLSEYVNVSNWGRPSS